MDMEGGGGGPGGGWWGCGRWSGSSCGEPSAHAVTTGSSTGCSSSLADTAAATCGSSPPLAYPSSEESFASESSSA